MTNNEQDYDIATIRKLLLAAFTAEGLRRFCQDRHVFRPIVEEFGPGHGLGDMVDRVLDYCRTKLLWDELLAAVKDANPRQYARFFEPDLPIPETEKPREKEPPEPSPVDLATIASPISLELVRVPAGEFRMGSDPAEDEDAEDEEFPPHPVYVPEFYVAKYPVTNMQYLHFVRVTGHDAPSHWKKGNMPRRIANHPVSDVSWRDALAFCAWLSQETGQPFRLPTEAEWEKAARGTDGRIYPWGNDWDADRCNSAEGGPGTTTPVGQYSPAGDSPYGCADMVGNVLEWCQSLYRDYPYQAGDGREALEAGDEVRRVLRGGACDYPQAFVRCAFRGGEDPDFWFWLFGFRVVVAPGPSGL